MHEILFIVISIKWVAMLYMNHENTFGFIILFTITLTNFHPMINPSIKCLSQSPYQWKTIQSTSVLPKH